MTTVLDYETPPASPQVMMAHGVIGAVCYIAPAAWGWPKAITPPQLRANIAAGFLTAFNFEKNPNDYTAGFAGGVTTGQDIEIAMRELAMPITQPVYVSYDTDIPASAFTLAADYHRGVRSVCKNRTVDMYGENALVEYLAGLGLAQRGWMSESGSFPGNAAPTAHTVLQQHYGQTIAGLGGSYDVNTVIKSDWGQYLAGTSPITVMEDTMLINPRRVKSTVPGRDATVGFDVTSKTFFGANGVLFTGDAKVWKIVDWPAGNPTGLSCSAQFIGAEHGDVDWAEQHDGSGVYMYAKGDAGTFDLEYLNMTSDPFTQGGGATPVDYATLTAAVAARLTIAAK